MKKYIAIAVLMLRLSCSVFGKSLENKVSENGKTIYVGNKVADGVARIPLLNKFFGFKRYKK
jgi:hypothetical protein